MKKVVTVQIGNEVFQMEEDGYAKIRIVLKKIESASANGPVLVKDIEQRIAVMLKEKASGANLVTCEQVDEVINILGYAAYLKEEPFQSFNHPQRSGYRKLYRHPNDKVIGGVCGGIAAYLNTDPVLIRVLFVIFFGLTLFPYLILWIAVPLARAQEQISGPYL